MSGEPVPSTVEGCCDEVARAGWLLKRTVSNTVTYELIDLSSESPRLIHTFTHPAWTEIECVQAAVRFMRYFQGDESE